MSDVGERSAVYERGGALERLDKVGREGVGEKQRHGAARLELSRPDWAPVTGIPNDDSAEALFQILRVSGQTEDRHDLGGRGDEETILPGDSASGSAEADYGSTQRPIVHVHRPLPGDAPRVEVQRIPLLQVVVEHRREKGVRRGDRVEITGEVEVDVHHRHDLGVATACRPTLDPEHGAQARLPEAESNPLVTQTQGVGEPHRHSRLSFTRRGRARAGHEDQPAASGLPVAERVQADLGLVAAEQLQVGLLETELGRDLGDRG